MERNEGTEEGEDGKTKVGTPSTCSSTGDGERGMQERKRKPPLLAIVAPPACETCHRCLYQSPLTISGPISRFSLPIE
ncbi:hypothetical protein U1Q18_032172, partial [Sarracenia purpurea var. burkii]